MNFNNLAYGLFNMVKIMFNIDKKYVAGSQEKQKYQNVPVYAKLMPFNGHSI